MPMLSPAGYKPTGNVKAMQDHMVRAGVHNITALALAQLFDTFYKEKEKT